MNDEQIKHMAERFLRWPLPKDFAPDGGITFEPVGNAGTRHVFRRCPFGTNILNYTQAIEMVRYMTERLRADLEHQANEEARHGNREALDLATRQQDEAAGAAYEAAAGCADNVAKTYDVLKADRKTYEPRRVQQAAKSMVRIASEDIRALTPSDATAALEARDARVWNEAVEAAKQGVRTYFMDAGITAKRERSACNEAAKSLDALKKTEGDKA